MIPARLLPDVEARVRERLVFNFAIPLEAARRWIPAPWLEPLEVRPGLAALSFCVLDLEGIAARGLPRVVTLSGLQCAHRLAVREASPGAPPAVFLEERLTASWFAAAFTRLGFPCRRRHVTIAVSAPGPRRTIEVLDGGGIIFAAEVATRAPDAPSRLFEGASDFGRFIREGSVSYAPGVAPRRLHRVDLLKEESGFEPLRVVTVEDRLVSRLAGSSASALVDSAFLTRGPRYRWCYRASIPFDARAGATQLFCAG